MNLFVLDKDPVIAAQLQCDKHVVKMIVESAQMLCTTHRMLDGNMKIEERYVEGSLPARYRKIKRWTHPDKELDSLFYKAVHMNHPCTKWTMLSACNYEWHYRHFIALCDEYQYRYNRQHSTDALLRSKLKQHPRNILKQGLTLFPLAMKSNPECMFPDDPVKSYKLYYQTKQSRFKMTWKDRAIPEWFVTQTA